MRKMNVGVVGCGNISSIYLENGTGPMENIRIAAVADLVPERAKAQAEVFGIERVLTTEQLLGDPDIDIVLNITIPKAHAEVSLAALEAGKHVYLEKPLAITREGGKRMLALAERKGLLIGGAPDTFLGAGIQTCRKLIDDGWIGTPIAATAFMTCRGHESWHPDPEFYYKAGGGPMFDMGPYYLTALVNLLGPIAKVSGMARVTFAQRTITSAPKFGALIDVDVPTHVAGQMAFASGAIGTIIQSFDIYSAHLPRIEVYGSEGSLSVPDPNTFGGPVKLMHRHSGQWQEVPLAFANGKNSRGIGLSDMAGALMRGRPHRASGQLCYHVLDVMHAFHDAASSGAEAALESTCPRPAALPLGLRDGQVD